MTLEEIDKTGLIRESYLIEGIKAPECRSIFLDWAIKLPASVTPQAAAQRMLDAYGADNPDHPMTGVLRESLADVPASGRRGGRKARVGPDG